MAKDTIWFYSIIIFAFVGALTVGNVVHEYTHMFTYSKINKINDNLCALNLPTLDNYKDYDAIGNYKLSFNGQNELYNKLDKHSELKAYLLGFIPLILFTLCFYVIMYRRINNEN